jgi:hypothetical protein
MGEEIAMSDEQTADLATANEHITAIRELVNNYLADNRTGLVLRNIEFGRSNELELRHIYVCQCTNEGDKCEWKDNH